MKFNITISLINDLDKFIDLNNKVLKLYVLHAKLISLVI